MTIPIYQVDAFSGEVFRGNPAAICPLEKWLEPAMMQAIAAENNLAETAFFVRAGEAYELRWFTPTVEVDLCGHATLASAYVLWERLGFKEEEIAFDTRSGRLRVTRSGRRIHLDFPSRPPQECVPHPELIAALGAAPKAILAARDYVVVYESEAEVAALRPDMRALAGVDRFAVIATAAGDTVDFVSRFFAPAQGIDEDPVTGSAHSTLIPYWGQVLGKTEMRARQISERAGKLWCGWRGERVEIGGEAALYLEGTITIG